jgi:hypothetical protein
LFERGLEAMRAGEYASACPALSESYLLDPLPGALFTLAECEAAWGKLATAVEHYQSFLNSLTALPPERRDKFEERRRMALEKIASLMATAPELTVEAPQPAPPNLRVTRNGEPIAPDTFGVGKKVDPGEYVISADVDGQTVFERRVVLAERDRARVEVSWPRASAPSATESAPAHPAAKVELPASSPPPSNGVRTWAYVVGGAGALGLATGVIAGAMAWSKKDSIQENCPNRQCNGTGRQAVDSAKRAAAVSTVGFSVAAAGLAGTVLLLLLPERHDPTAALQPRPLVVASRESVGLSVTGCFE